ncbi:MAG: Nif3-like dinuclear metal center hexameric protein, partial [Clostridia bacterium]|nr:Nif3-like dinuclear metal center hexameric protein [Clostridia bacterium]
NTAKISFYDYLDKIKTNLKVDTVKITGKIPHDVEKVAIGTGSSSSFIEEIKYLDVDVFITGEIKYDNLKSLAFEKPAVIELGHYESEECFIDDLSNLLSKRFPKLDVITYKKRISIYI